MLLSARDMVTARFLEIDEDYATLLDISIDSTFYPENEGVVRCLQFVITIIFYFYTLLHIIYMIFFVVWWILLKKVR